MKNRTQFYALILSVALLGSIAFAQNAPIDFEAGGNGANWTWTTFENPPNDPMEIVANPDPTGINTSATVAKYTALQTSPPFAGVESMHGADIGTFTLDASNSTVKIMVWKPTISDVGIKFATLPGGSTGEFKVANTVTNQWEELVFDFSAKIGEPTSTDIDQIVIFPDFDLGGRTQDNVVYFDNITFSPQIIPPQSPTDPAPTPTADANDVISLYSNAYNNEPVDTWSAVWDDADVADTTIAGDDVKLYTNLVFAGIEFTSQLIDASAMTNFTMDIWTPDPTAPPAVFKIKLVDFGADGMFGGGDDSEHEVILDANTNPAISSGNWVTLDLPFSAFTGLTARGNLAQLIIAGDPNRVFVDNVYFYDSNLPTEPTDPAPTPTIPPSDVISLFSNAYTDVPVDTWLAGFSNANLTDTTVAGDDVKRYTNLVFAGIEFVSQTIDATGMTHFSMDFWTPDPTNTGSFEVKLVDFGADGVFGGGDDTEGAVFLDQTTTPAIGTGSWFTLSIPFADYPTLLNREHLAQLIIAGAPNTVFVDNVYFYDSNMVTEPVDPAPTPTRSASDVISLYSNAYTDVPVDTWSAVWDNADVADVQVGGDDVKLYTNLVFAGIEFTSQTVDATGMTHFTMDFWTPDPTDMGTFEVKLVDFGADGMFGGGDDTEGAVFLDQNTTPSIGTGNWYTLSIPFTDYPTLLNREHLAQLIIAGAPNTVYVDNVYFYNDAATGIEQLDTALPVTYELEQNYPNPFNPTTNIRFSIPQADQVTVKVHNMLGQEVATLVNGFMNQGTYQIDFDATDLPTGIYVYSIVSGSFSSAKKMMLVK